MKLKAFEQKHDYEFIFVFENGECKEVNLESLVAKYLQPDELGTTMINYEWGCLEFKDGAVDIEPNTLYKFCDTHNQSQGG